MKLPFFSKRKRRRPADMAALLKQARANLALPTAILASEPFRTLVRPVPLDPTTRRRLLVLAPHQHDEALGAGGTLLMARAAGARTQVVYLTDGAEKGDESGSVAVRSKEAADACEWLGAERADLGLSNIRVDPTRAAVERLASLIHDFQPDALLVPWLLDGTAKHRMANHLLWLANHGSPLPATEVWGFQVNNAFDPNAFVDITEVAEQKRKLLELYRSQNEKLLSFDHIGMGLSAWNSKWLPKNKGSHEPRYGEIFVAVTLRDHLDLIEQHYFADLSSTYLGFETIQRGMGEIHRAVTGAKVS